MSRKLTHEEFLSRVYEKNEHVRNGEIEIRGKYVNSKMPVECYCNLHHVNWNPTPEHIYRGSGCKQCGIAANPSNKPKKHSLFLEELFKLNNGIMTDDIYVNSKTPISFRCNNGHVWSSSPDKILQGGGCPYCAGFKVWPGFNDILTVRPDVAALITHQDDKRKYTSGSNKKIDFTCPLCGRVQKKIIHNVSSHGFACKCCGDGVSYPNKFGMAFFDQVLPDKYETEYSSNWTKPYIYDIYFTLNNIQYLVEWDGGFHYDDKEVYGQTLEERQEIDEIKNKLATDNNTHLIRVDCVLSDMEYIKSNILTSELSVLFDLSNINWLECDQKAQKNLVKTACDLYSSGLTSIKDITNVLHVSRQTVRDYLARGAKLGWCNYDANAYLQNLRRQIVATNMFSGQELYFSSITECRQEILKLYGIVLYHSNINRAIRNNGSHKGFTFRYINTDTTQN